MKGNINMAKFTKKQSDLKDYMIKNDLILEDVMEVVLLDLDWMNPISINQLCDEMKKKLTNKCLKEAA